MTVDKNGKIEIIEILVPVQQNTQMTNVYKTNGKISPCSRLHWTKQNKQCLPTKLHRLLRASTGWLSFTMFEILQPERFFGLSSWTFFTDMGQLRQTVVSLASNSIGPVWLFGWGTTIWTHVAVCWLKRWRIWWITRLLSTGPVRLTVRSVRRMVFIIRSLVRRRVIIKRRWWTCILTILYVTICRVKASGMSFFVSMESYRIRIVMDGRVVCSDMTGTILMVRRTR